MNKLASSKYALLFLLLAVANCESETSTGNTEISAQVLSESSLGSDPAKAQANAFSAMLAEATSEYKRTPINENARRWALINKAGKIPAPEAVDFLLDVALAPLPAPETLVSSVVDSRNGPCGSSKIEGEMAIRMAALRSLQSLGHGSQQSPANKALLKVAERADRLVRREAAIVLLHSVPDSEKILTTKQLRAVLPAIDSDVFQIQRRKSPQPAPALPVSRANARAKSNSNTPVPVK